MTSLPERPKKRLGLVIDLDICVGCHACAVACKAWNTQSGGGTGLEDIASVPLSDQDPYGAAPSGTWLNRIHSYEISPGAGAPAQLVHFPKSCLHCDDAPCVTVCPTGASYKRVEDGIVLVNEDACMGCGLCAWACPYGARELDRAAGVMKKCTLCVDRIYDEALPEEDRVPACVRACPAGARAFGDLADPESEASRLSAARGGMDLMPEQGTKPVNRYLPPRPRDAAALPAEGPDLAALCQPGGAGEAGDAEPGAAGFLGWVDRALARLEGAN
ncbi:MAG: 4Fe-4S dicluster domain-containing protein [Pseudomonadota bacterium]